jgi:hypothetical protein
LEKSPSSAYVFTMKVVGVGTDPDDAFDHALTKLESDMGSAMHGPIEFEEISDNEASRIAVAYVAFLSTGAEA